MMKVEVRLCVENYAGKVRKYKKRTVSAAEKDAMEYREKVHPYMSFRAVWIETREISSWKKLDGSETRR